MAIASPLKVSPATEGQVRKIAATVSPRSTWVAAQKKFEGIAALLLADQKAQGGRKARSAVEALVGAVLRGLDDEYSWDFPRMSEAVEDNFYTWFAEQYVRKYWT